MCERWSGANASAIEAIYEEHGVERCDESQLFTKLRDSLSARVTFDDAQSMEKLES